MLLRARLIRGIFAIFCVAAALNFGLTTLRAGVIELHHYVHGDQAATDGGWIITDAHDGEHHDVNTDSGHTDADGHHHHSAGDHAAPGLPATSDAVAAPPGRTAEAPALAQRLDDSDPGVSGPVPRVLVRTV